MKKLVILLFAIALIFPFSAQEEQKEYETYDVVSLKDGGLIKGEIMSFDEPSGGIVFKDKDGKVYSFSREDYDYFLENQSFLLKEKTFVLKERKNDEIALQVGFTARSVVYRQFFDPASYASSGDQDYTDGSFDLKIAGGKFINSRNYVGITLEYPISAYSDSYFSGGLRYNHYYDSEKKNLGLYIPIEFQYFKLSGAMDMDVRDTIFYSGGGVLSPTSYQRQEFSMDGLTLSLGQGFTCIMDDKKYLSIEVSAHNVFGLKEEFENDQLKPDKTFKGGGFKISALFGF